MAQNASAKIAVTVNLQSSISLVFQNNAAVGSVGFCPLTNAGTNNVDLDLGTASRAGGDSLTCVAFARLTGPARYEVSSSFDVQVQKANTASANYRLAVSLSSAPPANVVWLLNATTLTTAAQTISAAAAYGRVTEALHVQVRNTVAAGALFETITFTANAN